MFKFERSGFDKLAVGILTSLLTLSLSVNVANATSTNGTNINMRSEASLSSSNVTQIANAGTEVNVLDIAYNSTDNMTWVKCSVGEYTGYIYSELLNYTGEANATIIDEPTRIRKTPSLINDLNVLSNYRLKTNDRVQVISQSGTFYCIVFNNKLYYIHSTLAVLDSEINDHQLTDEDVERQIESDKEDKEIKEEIVEEFIEDVKAVESKEISVGDNVYTNVKNLNFRSEMNLNDSSKKYLLAAGTKLTVLEIFDEWYKVSYKEDEGYVAKQYVSKIVEGNIFVEQAMALCGKYYNEDFNGVKLDCSGLIYYVYKVLNEINIPRTCAGQKNCGTPVTFENLLPGDLVFFINNTHVGMYIGEGQFIQAENYNIPIRVTSFYNDSMDHNYWAEKFTKGVRIIQ